MGLYYHLGTDCANPGWINEIDWFFNSPYLDDCLTELETCWYWPEASYCYDKSHDDFFRRAIPEARDFINRAGVNQLIRLDRFTYNRRCCQVYVYKSDHGYVKSI